MVHEVQILDTKIGDLRLELNTVKLGDKERFDKEQIGVKEPFSVTKKFHITKLDLTSKKSQLIEAYLPFNRI